MSSWRRRAAEALAFAIVWALAGAGAPAGAASVALTDVTVAGGAQPPEVRLKLTGRATAKAMLLTEPWRLVLDLHGVDFRWRQTPTSVGGALIREVRGSQYDNGAARVVIELTRRATWVIERTADGLRVTFPEAAARPAPTPPPAATAAPAAVPRPRGAFEVQGIIVRDGVPVAYIRDPVSGQVRSYRAGDRVGDALIEKIGEREVLLSTRAGPVEVRLEGPGR